MNPADEITMLMEQLSEAHGTLMIVHDGRKCVVTYGVGHVFGAPTLIEALRLAAAVRACRVCGCTDDHACPGGCWWVEGDLCSTCAAKQEEAA